MANRVLAGKHATHGYGVFVSKENIDVTAADNDFFIFDSTANTGTSGNSVAQCLFWREVVYTDSAHNVAQTYTFDSYGRQCFAMSFASTTAGSTDGGNDIKCVSQAANSARAKAELGLHGGTLGINDSFVVPTYTISITNSGTTGTVSVTPYWEGGSGNDIAVQMLVFTEGI